MSSKISIKPFRYANFRFFLQFMTYASLVLLNQIMAWLYFLRVKLLKKTCIGIHWWSGLVIKNNQKRFDGFNCQTN